MNADDNVVFQVDHLHKMRDHVNTYIDHMEMSLAQVQQRMRKFQVGIGEVRHDLGNLFRVRSRLGRSVHRALESTRRDEFHRASNLANIFDGFKSLDQCANVGHELSNFPTMIKR